MLIPIITKFVATGINQADRSFKKLAKTTLLSTASLTGMAYALQRLTKAAMEDEKAQTALNKTLANAGWSKATESVNAYIAATQRATGVGDDELRPSFTSLFGALQDANAAMGAQALAMDLAAGTGKDLATVSDSLAKAFAGQRKGLVSLGTGLDATFLKTADLNDVMAAFATRYAGQAEAAAATTAGKMAILSDAAGEASETIGSALIDAFATLVGNGDVQQAATAIDNAAAAVGRFIRESSGAERATTWLTAFLYELGQGFKSGPLAALAKLMGAGMPENINVPSVDSSVISSTLKALKNQTALQKTLAKLEADRAKATKAAATKAAAAAAATAAKARAAEAAKKKQAALDKAAAELTMKYDIERIGLAAAYAKETDYGTKQRIADLATLNTLQYAENLGLTTMAEIIARTMADLNGVVLIMEQIVSKQQAWTSEVSKTAEKYAGLLTAATAFMNASTGSPAQFRAAEELSKQGSISGALNALNPLADASPADWRTVENRGWAQATAPIPYAGTPNIQITVQGTVVSENDFNQAVADAMNHALRSGQSVPRLYSTL